MHTYETFTDRRDLTDRPAIKMLKYSQVVRVTTRREGFVQIDGWSTAQVLTDKTMFGDRQLEKK